MAEFQVTTSGLQELRRDLRAIDPALARGLSRELKEAAQPIAAQAAARAPRRTGRLAASIRPTVRGSRVYIGSRLPYANWIHWRRGGTPFISQALESREEQVVDALGAAVERIAREHGW